MSTSWAKPINLEAGAPVQQRITCLNPACLGPAWLDEYERVLPNGKRERVRLVRCLPGNRSCHEAIPATADADLRPFDASAPRPKRSPSDVAKRHWNGRHAGPSKATRERAAAALAAAKAQVDEDPLHEARREAVEAFLPGESADAVRERFDLTDFELKSAVQAEATRRGAANVRELREMVREEQPRDLAGYLAADPPSTQNAPRRILCHPGEAQMGSRVLGEVEAVSGPSDAISDPAINEEEQPMPNSATPPTEEQRQHAVRLILDEGKTQREASRLSGVPAGSLYYLLDQERKRRASAPPPAADPSPEVGAVDSAATHAPCDVCGNLTRIGIDCRCNARKVPKGSPVVTACGSPSPETREHLVILGAAVSRAMQSEGATAATPQGDPELTREEAAEELRRVQREQADPAPATPLTYGERVSRVVSDLEALGEHHELWSAIVRTWVAALRGVA